MSKTSNYPITVGKIDTSMNVTLAPTSPIPPQTPDAIEGRLVDKWGAGLGGKTVALMVNGVDTMHSTTAQDGGWSFSFALTEGSHQVYATFTGDASYNGSSTSTYTVVCQKIATTMTVTDPPPTTAPPDTAILFAGYLTSTIGKLNGMTVDLWVDGAKVGSGVTGAGGSWSWQFTLGPGSHTVYAEFAGTAVYAGCEAGFGGRPLLALGIGVAVLAVAGIAAARWLPWREQRSTR